MTTDNQHDWYTPRKHQQRCDKCGLWKTKITASEQCIPHMPLILSRPVMAERIER